MSKNTPVIQELVDAKFYNDMAVENKMLAERAFNNAREMIVSDKDNSTKDLLRDYVIVVTQKDNTELVKSLHCIEDSLSGKAGELILFTYILNGDTVKLFLGILTSDKLVVNPQKKLCDFSIDKLIEDCDYRNLVHVTENIVFKNLILRSISVPTAIDFISPCSWKLTVGSQAVINWMHNNSQWKKCVIKIADKLGVFIS